MNTTEKNLDTFLEFWVDPQRRDARDGTISKSLSLEESLCIDVIQGDPSGCSLGVVDDKKT